MNELCWNRKKKDLLSFWADISDEVFLVISSHLLRHEIRFSKSHSVCCK